MIEQKTAGTAKRFYKAVTVEPRDQGFVVQLDGRPLRTPAKRLQLLPTQAGALLVAAEFAAQKERIDPPSMPVTRLANSALDGVVGQQAAVASSIVQYAAGDLVCYRADFPEPLRQRQSDAWDPVLGWFRDTHWRQLPGYHRHRRGRAAGSGDGMRWRRSLRRWSRSHLRQSTS